MPISSVIISCRAENAVDVKSRINRLSHVEIHHLLDNGSIVAVLETATVEEEVSLVKKMLLTDGVLDVRLAYHNFEDLGLLHT